MTTSILPMVKEKIRHPQELEDYRLCKRKQFEELLRTQARWNSNTWIQYAEWEESQNDFNRVRSIWERSLEVHYNNHTLWIKYAEMEIKNKFINYAAYAKSILERAVTLLPRIDQLWYKYIHIEEEILGNVSAARNVFERWMNWMPDQQHWFAYIEFELCHNEIERAITIFKRFGFCHPEEASKYEIDLLSLKMKNSLKI